MEIATHKPLYDVLQAIKSDEKLIQQCRELSIDKQEQVMDIVSATVQNDIGAVLALFDQLDKNGINSKIVIENCSMEKR